MADSLQRPERSVRKTLSRLPPQLWLAVIVVGIMLISSLVSKLRSPTPTRNSYLPAIVPAPTPVATPVALKNTLALPIETAISAASKGDLTTYLAQFTSPLRDQLERTRTDKGSDYLQNYLKRLTRPLKGVATNLSKTQTTAPNETRVAVEFIYANRSEAQSFFLRREGDLWRISRIDSVRFKPILIPYGTPMNELR